MKEIKLSWATLKTQISSRKLKIQYTDLETKYYVYAIDGIILFSCEIEKDEDTPTADRTDFETNHKSTANQNINDQSNSPFAAKTIGTKKLYKRVHGVKMTIAAGATVDIDLIVPYNECKISAIDIVGTQIGDVCDFEVYDTPTGTISTVPNLMLNQFGYAVNVAKDYYREESSYDADLIKDMKLEVHYTNNGSSSITVGVNFILHELK